MNCQGFVTGEVDRVCSGWVEADVRQVCIYVSQFVTDESSQTWVIMSHRRILLTLNKHSRVISATNWTRLLAFELRPQVGLCAAAAAAGGWSVRDVLSASSSVRLRHKKFAPFPCLFNNSLIFSFCLCDVASLKMDGLCCGLERLQNTTQCTFLCGVASHVCDVTPEKEPSPDSWR